MPAVGSFATYATGEPRPPAPFWELLFKNIRVCFLGSDEFPGRGEGRSSTISGHRVARFVKVGRGQFALRATR